MAKFKIVMVSKDEKFLFSEEDINVFKTGNERYSDNVIFEKIGNNADNLTTVYNRKIEESKDVDFLVLMHSDVTLDFQHFLEHVEECSSKYDVMGLCGCKKIVTSQSPLNWFTGSIPNPNSRWGCVTHGELNNSTSFFSQDRSETTDSPVACIDGLCIVLTKKALESGLRFDEKFSFDFYDTDISFTAIMKNKLRVGVIVETSLRHYSVGKSILTKDFLSHEIDFRKKWNLPIPQNSPIRRLFSETNS